MNLLWFGGNLYKRGSIDLSPFNRGLNLGDGLFETLLVVDQKALWAEEHLARMKSSAQALGLVFPRNLVEQAIRDIEAASGIGAGALRLTLTRGATSHGLGDDGGDPVVLATCVPFDSSLIGKPLRLATSLIRRNPTSFASCHKSLSYVDGVVAMREAEAKEADGALMLNVAGKAASTAIGNIFLIKGEELITPGVDQAILPGIMRMVLLQLADSLGLRRTERDVEQNEIFTADCLFQTNSLRLLNPILRIDEKMTGGRDSRFLLQAIVKEAQSKFNINILTGAPHEIFR